MSTSTSHSEPLGLDMLEFAPHMKQDFIQLVHVLRKFQSATGVTLFSFLTNIEVPAGEEVEATPLGINVLE